MPNASGRGRGCWASRFVSTVVSFAEDVIGPLGVVAPALEVVSAAHSWLEQGRGVITAAPEHSPISGDATSRCPGRSAAEIGRRRC